MGTYNSVSLAPNPSTNSGFRSMGSTINSILSGIGLTQTADTGQINWTTVNAPTSTNQTMGYEIWRFNDTLQSTAPIFMKFKYSSASSQVTSPVIYFSLGTGSDGAGNLNGQYITDIQTGYLSYGSDQNFAAPLRSNACYNTTYGVMWFSLWRYFQSSSTANMFNFYIGRSSDLTSGLPNGDGVSVGCTAAGSNSANTFKSYVFSTGAVFTIGSQAYSIPGAYLGLVSGGSQIWRPMGAYPDGRAHSWLGETRVDQIADGTQFSTALIGSTSLNFMSIYQENSYMNSNGNGMAKVLLYQ
jgi:hypothetical protein